MFTVILNVNGKRVDIPSYQVKAEDMISVSEKLRGSDKMKAIVETCGAADSDVARNEQRDAGSESCSPAEPRGH